MEKYDILDAIEWCRMKVSKGENAIPDNFDIHIDLLEELNLLVFRDRITGSAYDPEKGTLYYRK